jgi:hypothetical protein
MNIARGLCVVAGLLLSATGMRLHAQEAKPALCFEDLVCRNWCELEQIYRQAKPGNIPTGFLHGHVVFCPDELLAKTKGRMSTHVWHGKHFLCDGTLINQWAGVKAIRAKVDYGTSWLDGQPAIIFDYSGMSRVWHDVRDETREVAPGLYVGLMYKGCPCAEVKVFFVLRAESCCK